jgi:hypothetical protein
MVLNKIIFLIKKVSSSYLYISYSLTNRIRDINEKALSIGAAYILIYIIIRSNNIRVIRFIEYR